MFFEQREREGMVMTRNTCPEQSRRGTLVANGEVSIGTPTRRRTGQPAMRPGELRREIKRAEAVNTILLDAGNRPQQYLEAFKVVGGGE